MHRLFEIIPGVLAWLTLLSLIVLSAKLPAVVVVFIVLYDLYWFLKVLYMFSHLFVSFRALRKNVRIDWRKRLEAEHPDDWGAVRHLIVFPMYREPYEVVRVSFESLLASNYPTDRFLVTLAVEERGGAEDRATAERVEREFSSKFGGFLVTYTRTVSRESSRARGRMRRGRLVPRSGSSSIGRGSGTRMCSSRCSTSTRGSAPTTSAS